MMTTLVTESADLVDILQRTLSRSDVPLPASKIASQLTGPFRTSRDDVARLLASMADQGLVHVFAPYRTKEHRYWTRDETAYVHDTLLSLLTTKPLTRSELKQASKARLRGVSESRVTTVLKELLARGQVQELPAFIGSRTRRLSTQPLDVTDYTDQAVRKLTEQLARHSVTGDQILAAFAARATIAQTTSATPVRTQPHDVSSDASETVDPAILDQIQERLREDLRQRNSPIALIAELRRALGFLDLTKSEFDQAVLELRRQQIVELDRHDHAERLPDDQRNDLVCDSRGCYFNAISFRRHQ